MGMFSRLNSWQKGFVFGLLGTTILSIIYSGILIFIDIRLAEQGAPHMCFAFTESVICSFEEAIYTRLGFIVVLVIVFGIPAGIFGALIGFIIDRTQIGR